MEGKGAGFSAVGGAAPNPPAGCKAPCTPGRVPRTRLQARASAADAGRLSGQRSETRRPPLGGSAADARRLSRRRKGRWRRRRREDAGAPGHVGANAGHIRALPRRVPRLQLGRVPVLLRREGGGREGETRGRQPPPLSPGVSPPSFAHPRALAEQKTAAAGVSRGGRRRGGRSGRRGLGWPRGRWGRGRRPRGGGGRRGRR